MKAFRVPGGQGVGLQGPRGLGSWTDIARITCFQKIHGFHALNHQIIEKSWDVTPVTHTRTHEQWKVEQYSVWTESAKMNPERSSNKLVFQLQLLCSDKHFVWGKNVSKCKLFEGVVENRSSSSSRLMRSGARTLLLHQARLTPTSAEPGLELRPNTNTNTRQIKTLSHQAQPIF